MAQRTRANYKSTAAGIYTTNGVGAITGALDNSMHQDLADSVVFILDGLDTDVLYQFQDDLISQGNVVQVVTGTGTSNGVTTGINSTEKAIGVLQNSVAAVSDVCTIMFSSVIGGVAAANMLFGLGHTFTFKCRVAIATLSDGTHRFKVNLGFGDVFSTAGDHANGAYFRYVDNVNGGKWQCVTVQGSTETVSDSGITPVATVFNVFQIQVDSTGTHVYFSIDGVVVQTHTANIPVGAAQYVAWAIRMYKTVGAVARTIQTDWYQILISRTAIR